MLHRAKWALVAVLALAVAASAWEVCETPIATVNEFSLDLDAKTVSITVDIPKPLESGIVFAMIRAGTVRLKTVTRHLCNVVEGGGGTCPLTAGTHTLVGDLGEFPELPAGMKLSVRVSVLQAETLILCVDEHFST